MLGRKLKLPLYLRLQQLIPPRSVGKFRRNFMFHWHLLNRVKGSTKQIAMGCAIGASVSMTPLVGFHLVLGGLVVILTRSSMVAMTVSSLAFGNPWTFPFIFWLNYRIGNIFINVENIHQDKTGFLSVISDLFRSIYQIMLGKETMVHFIDSLYNFISFMLPFLIGSIPLAIFMFLFVFYATEEAIIVYHDNRLKRKRKKLNNATRR